MAAVWLSAFAVLCDLGVGVACDGVEGFSDLVCFAVSHGHGSLVGLCFRCVRTLSLLWMLGSTLRMVSLFSEACDATVLCRVYCSTLPIISVRLLVIQ